MGNEPKMIVYTGKGKPKTITSKMLVTLTHGQHQWVKYLAFKKSISQSEIIRRCIANEMEKPVHSKDNANKYQEISDAEADELNKKYNDQQNNE